ncbi:MAG: hypothetical protein JOZ19_11435, partial [Rubrobacter sp.]|nr:hypothetical protein [Rubrobacter sp.]
MMNHSGMGVTLVNQPALCLDERTTQMNRIFEVANNLANDLREHATAFNEVSEKFGPEAAMLTAGAAALSSPHVRSVLRWGAVRVLASF